MAFDVTLPAFSGILLYVGPVAQLARAPVLHSGGRRFKSCRVHFVVCGVYGVYQLT